MTRATKAVPVALLTAFAACGGGTEPVAEVAPSMSIIAGAAITDTIESEPAQALIVEVRGSDGKAQPGVIVRFDARFPSRPGYDAVRVAPLHTFAYSHDITDTTDQRGRVFAAVQLGNTAGNATIVVTAPELGLRDSAQYVVKPGRPSQLLLAPHDTTIGVGRDVTLSASLSDRFGNPLDIPISYSVAGSACASATAATVRGSAVGSCWLKASAGPVADSARIAVLPDWTVVGYDYGTNEVVKVSLSDGRRTVVTSVTPSEVFPAAGLQGNVVFRSGSQVMRVRPDGTLIAPLVLDVLLDWSGWARLSRDETSVFFAGGGGVYRTNIDGTNTELLVPFGPTTPDPSPDGRFVAYSHNQQLAIYNLATKAITYPRKIGTMPRWSPAGDRIAFVSQRRVWVTNPDGTGLRAVTPDSVSVGDFPGLDWSADGQWVVTQTNLGLGLFKVEASDQVIARLGTVINVAVVR
jgi:hypothetical protein